MKKNLLIMLTVSASTLACLAVQAGEVKTVEKDVVGGTDKAVKETVAVDEKVSKGVVKDTEKGLKKTAIGTEKVTKDVVVGTEKGFKKVIGGTEKGFKDAGKAIKRAF